MTIASFHDCGNLFSSPMFRILVSTRRSTPSLATWPTLWFVCPCATTTGRSLGWHRSWTRWRRSRIARPGRRTEAAAAAQGRGNSAPSQTRTSRWACCDEDSPIQAIINLVGYSNKDSTQKINCRTSYCEERKNTFFIPLKKLANVISKIQMRIFILSVICSGNHGSLTSQRGLFSFYRIYF